MTAYGAVERVFSEAVERLARERRRLEVLSAQVEPQGFDRDGFLAMGRALSYVVMGGVLECFMRDLPRALATDVAALKIPRSSLPLGLVAALEAAAFRRCGDGTIGALLARTAILQGAVLHASDVRLVEDFSESLKLADGSTIGQKNFEALWALLNLPGEWRNAPNDVFLLREIKDKRNDVAHWEADPVDIGRSKRPSSLIEMVDQLIALLDHVLLNICYWFEERIPVSS
ncbi:hypothetical protein RB199_16320 [Streptomyces libani]|uniref:RiboL-PSP-HEPN domain-containing protein n=1 Tax=Streptomyces nigrescens TaxID=1920 RepID=A0A640TQY9_STRNI|nr:hypothetical protein [Streptomyces libani]WAT98959.1 hypothetical protein STRLI_005074 [Streptomyces libani subsp. libani]GFE24636.1 hypothetical protein Sliba_50890 [Streptomyces libani subsp. libani]GGV94884.1 hypothetical protein GCM10010500_33830 [Streptomyces libani subsp. libani]